MVSVSAGVVRALAVRGRSGPTVNVGMSRAFSVLSRSGPAVSVRMSSALSVLSRSATAIGVSVSISEGNLAWKQRDHKTYKTNDDFLHNVIYLFIVIGAVWMTCFFPGD